VPAYDPRHEPPMGRPDPVVMPDGFFPATEADAPARPLLDRLRPAVEAEFEARNGNASIHAELRTRRLSDGGLALRRFYWSTQEADPRSPYGFSARTLFCDDASAPRLHTFPADPAMPWLDDATGPLRADGRVERVEVLRYIPLRRLTFRLYDGAGLPPRVIAKAKGTSGLNRAATAVLAVHHAVSKRRSEAPRVPQLLRMDPPRHVLYLEELPGEPLTTAVSGLDLTAAMEHLGGLHRSLQEVQVRGLTARRTMEHWLADARQAVDRITVHVPSAAGRAEAAYDTLRRGVPEERQPLFCQGDFLPGQLLCDPSGWSVVDFDDSGYADPLSEVAAMYAAMPRELRVSAEQAEHARRTYLNAYADRAREPLDEGRWRWFLTLLHLVELGKRLAKGRVRPGETHEVLDRLAVLKGVTLR
jgi:aminoglycoside phosphotransferase